MNATMNYDERAKLIRNVLALSAPVGVERDVFAARLRMLGDIEIDMANSLHRSGMSRDVATHSAFLFVAGCVKAFRDERA